MKKTLLTSLICLLTIFSYGQVGIGTTTPDASSILDIEATDKGILIPRVSLNNVTTIQLDGTNNAATGLLIYNTNIATIGGSGRGFYYFDGVIWVSFGGTSITDADWHEQGSTNPPNAITDNIFTHGAVGMNTDAIASRGLNILSSTTETGNNHGIFNESQNNFTGDHIGIENRMNGTGNSRKYGTLNEISSTANQPAYGSFNRITGTGAGFRYGSYNEINGTGTGTHIASYNAATSSSNDNLYGSYNAVSGNGTGPHYATYNLLSGTGTGPQFSTYNDVNITGDGIHYGSQTVLSGTANLEKYGNSVIIDNTGSGTHTGTLNSLEGNGTGTQYGVNNRLFNSGNFPHYGTNNTLSGSGSGTHSGTRNILELAGTGTQYGVYNEITNTGDGNHYGIRNNLSGAGTGFKYGSFTEIDAAAGGTHYGMYSEVLKPGSYAGYFLGTVAVGTNTGNNYLLPTSRGTANQIIQTNATGITSWVDNNAIVAAENGLTNTASTVRLGGTLNQNTSIVHSTFDLNYNLSSSGDFNVQDNGITHFQVRDNGNSYFGGEVVLAEDNVAGTNIARLFNIFGQEGALYLYRNGLPQHRLDAGFTTIFNDQGVDVNFIIESDTNPQAFGVDAGENVMYAGTNVVSLTNNGAAVNGTIVEYVASFYRDDLTNGTAVQMGSTEYITDFGNLLWGPYGSWAPYSDNTFDLGSSTFRWDDVYATSGVVNTSDIRLKKNIKDLDYGLDEVMQLEPISYQWKNSRDASEVKIGFSAQQLLTVLPEVVKTHDFVYPDESGPGVLQENENLGVYYSDIIPVLTKAIQEQQSIIDGLIQRIEILENK